MHLHLILLGLRKRKNMYLRLRQRQYNRNEIMQFVYVCVCLQCTVTCGVGVQKRDVYCRLKGKGRVGEDICDARLRPSSLQQCLSPECHGYSWSVSEWQEVSFPLSH